MNYRASVRLLPELGTAEEMVGRTVVVIDVLRATTTICAAVANRAEGVIPAPSIPTAHELRETWPEALLGGERGGIIIDGFDLGNSPREYTPEKMAGRLVVLCTTNGTVAMEHCRGADAIHIGAFVNLSRVINALGEVPAITLVCAGTDRRVSSEDSLFAGAVLDGLVANGLAADEMDDSAQLAWAQWCQRKQIASSDAPHAGTSGLSEAIYDALLQSRGGRKLANIGYHDDIRFCSQVDHFDVLPSLDPAEWTIRDESRVAPTRR